MQSGFAPSRRRRRVRAKAFPRRAARRSGIARGARDVRVEKRGGSEPRGGGDRGERDRRDKDNRAPSRVHRPAPSAREREFGAHRAGLDARGDRRLHGAQPGVPLQRFERDDERVVANRREHDVRAAVAPVEARHGGAKVLLQRGRDRGRPARRLERPSRWRARARSFPSHPAGAGECGGIRRARRRGAMPRPASSAATAPSTAATIATRSASVAAIRRSTGELVAIQRNGSGQGQRPAHWCTLDRALGRPGRAHDPPMPHARSAG